MELEEQEFYKEQESRKKRLAAYAEQIQEIMLRNSCAVIDQLVEERHRQQLTQQDIADRTGILPSNLARFESGARIPTLTVLEKYARALGKHIEVSLCDGMGK